MPLFISYLQARAHAGHRFSATRCAILNIEGRSLPGHSPVFPCWKKQQSGPRMARFLRPSQAKSFSFNKKIARSGPKMTRLRPCYREVRTVATQERGGKSPTVGRSPRRLEEHTSELQSLRHIV